jgi:hypothetical protein
MTATATIPGSTLVERVYYLSSSIYIIIIKRGISLSAELARSTLSHACHNVSLHALPPRFDCLD